MKGKERKTPRNVYDIRDQSSENYIHGSKTIESLYLIFVLNSNERKEMSIMAQLM